MNVSSTDSHKTIGPVKQNLFLSVKLLFSYQSILTYVLGGQKSCLIEMVLFEYHTTTKCFG